MIRMWNETESDYHVLPGPAIKDLVLTLPKVWSECFDVALYQFVRSSTAAQLALGLSFSLK